MAAGSQLFIENAYGVSCNVVVSWSIDDDDPAETASASALFIKVGLICRSSPSAETTCTGF